MTRNRPTLRLSEQGRTRIEKARREKEWTKDDERWLRAAHQRCNREPEQGWQAYWETHSHQDSFSPSKSTLKNRFLRGFHIKPDFFEALCAAVGVDAQDVADLDNPSIIGYPPEQVDADFYGRTTALNQLQEWIRDQDRCRLILVHGRAAIGKTVLVYQSLKRVASEFDFLVWLSLESAPLLSELLNQVIPYLSHGQISHGQRQGIFSDFLQCLIQSRCLVVLDQWEVILAGNNPGKYRKDYQDYGELLKQVCRNHKSCVLVLSREKPQSIEFRKLDRAVQSLELSGLNYEEDKPFLTAKGLSGTEAELKEFMRRYNNPLILKSIAEQVSAVYKGRVSMLVSDGTTIYSNEDISDIMREEFQLLPEIEQEIVYWLSIWRNPVAYDVLRRSVLRSTGELHNVLNALITSRSIVKVKSDLDQEDAVPEYLLEPITLKYVTQRFVNRNIEELSQAIESPDIRSLPFLVRYAFVTGDDLQLRTAQQRRIVKPIVEQLLNQFGSSKLKQTLEQLKTIADGYALQNITELLIEFKQ